MSEFQGNWFSIFRLGKYIGRWIPIKNPWKPKLDISEENENNQQKVLPHARATWMNQKALEIKISQYNIEQNVRVKFDVTTTFLSYDFIISCKCIL